MLRDEMISDQPEELRDRAVQSEALSIPFYELFRLNTQVVDVELEQWGLAGGAKTRVMTAQQTEQQDVLQYSQLIARFPRDSINRVHVEQLRNQAQQLATLQFIAKKYRLSVQELCRLLDEDGVFDDQGELQLERMQQIALAVYRQSKSQEESRARTVQKLQKSDEDTENTREEHVRSHQAVELEYLLEVPPIFQGQCNIQQYNYLLRNEPYIEVLQYLFPKRAIPDPLLDIFSKLNVNYGLKDEVTNVLIHYIHVLNKSWAKAYIEAVATELLARQITTYEQAVSFVRDQLKARQGQTEGKSTTSRSNRQSSNSQVRTGKNQKPKMVVQYQAEEQTAPLSAEELAEIQKMAAQLDGNKADR
jgi:replication initiation and membrane attachment protein